jgi:hypothetical protein
VARAHPPEAFTVQTPSKTVIAGGAVTEHIDAVEVSTRLWQGARPPEGRVLHQAGFRALVLCERAYQPGASAFPGIGLVIGACLDDDEPRRLESQAAIAAAHAVASAVAAGAKTLVTCGMGLNRSGLVTGLALLRLRPDLSAEQAVAVVRAERPGALYNPAFVALIQLMGSMWSGRLCSGLRPSGCVSAVEPAPTEPPSMGDVAQPRPPA